MFIKVLLLSIAFLAIAFFGFALNIIFKKNGEFPNSSISKNTQLRKMKIYCFKTEQKIIDKQIKGIRSPEGPSCSC